MRGIGGGLVVSRVLGLFLAPSNFFSIICPVPAGSEKHWRIKNSNNPSNAAVKRLRNKKQSNN